jgi:hypothetical protein
VNLEQPWTRTALGFDSRDDVLDVTVTDNLSQCKLKDEDERCAIHPRNRR